MTDTTLALVGATGGAGTTRTAVELAAMGARCGERVAVLDAAYATQGLSEYVSGRIDPDLTQLVTDSRDAALQTATHEIGAQLPGTVAIVPARAPFERIARAKTAEAARALEERIDEAAETYDRVVIDTPPVAANQAVAAVTHADSVAAVIPASQHGRDGLQRLRGRLQDVGTGLNVAISIRGDVSAADVGLPETDPTVASAPVAGTAGDAYGEAVAAAYEMVFDTSLDVEFEENGVLDRIARHAGEST